jgi:hypothetical protein
MSIHWQQVGSGVTNRNIPAQPSTINQEYPVYLEERELLPRIGLEAFWHHEQFDFLNPTRPNLAKITIN